MFSVAEKELYAVGFRSSKRKRAAQIRNIENCLKRFRSYVHRSDKPSNASVEVTPEDRSRNVQLEIHLSLSVAGSQGRTETERRVSCNPLNSTAI